MNHNEIVEHTYKVASGIGVLRALEAAQVDPNAFVKSAAATANPDMMRLADDLIYAYKAAEVHPDHTHGVAQAIKAAGAAAVKNIVNAGVDAVSDVAGATQKAPGLVDRMGTYIGDTASKIRGVGADALGTSPTQLGKNVSNFVRENPLTAAAGTGLLGLGTVGGLTVGTVGGLGQGVQAQRAYDAQNPGKATMRNLRGYFGG